MHWMFLYRAERVISLFYKRIKVLWGGNKKKKKKHGNSKDSSKVMHSFGVKMWMVMLAKVSDSGHCPICIGGFQTVFPAMEFTLQFPAIVC